LNGLTTASIAGLIDEVDAVNKWDNDKNNKENKVVKLSDWVEGGITYTFASSPYFNNGQHYSKKVNDYFGAAPTDTKHSIIDACWIKTYNGIAVNTIDNGGQHYLQYLDLLTGDLDGDGKIDKPQWRIVNWSTAGNCKDKNGNFIDCPNDADNYVKLVSEQQVP